MICNQRTQTFLAFQQRYLFIQISNFLINELASIDGFLNQIDIFLMIILMNLFDQPLLVVIKNVSDDLEQLIAFRHQLAVNILLQ